MNKKEIKNLAKRIADAEYIIQNSLDKEEVKKAKSTIMELSKRITSFEDMMILDEIIQEYFSEKA